MVSWVASYRLSGTRALHWWASTCGPSWTQHRSAPLPDLLTRACGSSRLPGQAPHQLCLGQGKRSPTSLPNCRVSRGQGSLCAVPVTNGSLLGCMSSCSSRRESSRELWRETDLPHPLTGFLDSKTPGPGNGYVRLIWRQSIRRLQS